MSWRLAVAVVVALAQTSEAARPRRRPRPRPRPPATAATPAPTVTASSVATTEERLQKVQERRKGLESELQELRGQERSLLGQVQSLEVEVKLRTEELREIQLVLRKAHQEMDAAVKRAEALERTLDAARPVVRSRARALYKLGELSYVRLLLSVERPSEIFRGYRFVTTLAREDRERVAAFRNDLNALGATRDELAKKTREALALQGEVEKRRRRLDEDRTRKTALLTQIVERKETHAAFLEELEEAEGTLRQLLSGVEEEGSAAVPIAALQGSLPWPVEGRVRIPFGLRKHPRFDTHTLHNGIEIAAETGTPVRAVHEGSVLYAARFRGYGLMVIVDHGNKHHSLYAHLEDAAVETKQVVKAGDVIGSVGSGLEGTGLYFELRYAGRPVDPADWLMRAGR